MTILIEYKMQELANPYWNKQNPSLCNGPPCTIDVYIFTNGTCIIYHNTILQTIYHWWTYIAYTTLIILYEGPDC